MLEWGLETAARVLKKLFQQLYYQCVPIARASTYVRNRRKCACQQRPNRRDSFGTPQSADERFLDRSRPARNSRYAAVCYPRVLHDSRIIEIHAKTTGHSAYIHLSSTRDLVKLTMPNQPEGVSGDRDRSQNLALSQCRLAIAQKKFHQRQTPFAIGRNQNDLRIERQEHRGRITDRRSGHQVAPNRCSIPYLARTKPAQHCCQSRKFTAEGIPNPSQSRRTTDPPLLVRRLQSLQFGDSLQRNHYRESHKILCDPQSQLGRAGYELRIRIQADELEQFRERIRAIEHFAGKGIGRSLEFLWSFLERRGKSINSSVDATLSETFQRGITNRPVPCASAEIAAQLIIELPFLLQIVAVKSFEHRHDETGSAV